MRDQQNLTMPYHLKDGHGRHAERPRQIPLKGLRDVFWRTYAEINEDRVTLISAGVTYYLLLAFFPALAMLVTLYGFIADPVTLASQMDILATVLPPGALDIVLDQLRMLTSQKTSTLSFAFLVSFLLALWSANNGIKALFDAMNVAYGEEEKRSFVKLNLWSLAFTLGAVVIAVSLIFAIGVLPAIFAFMRLDGWAEIAARVVRWPIMLLLVGGGTVLIYLFGPSRENAKLRWVIWGAAISTFCWMVMSILFSYYLENFANYNATYGTLGALIGLMVWIWLSVTILIVGAEVNAELEHQTVKDSTTGAPLPMGDRGAAMADSLGKSADDIG